MLRVFQNKIVVVFFVAFMVANMAQASNECAKGFSTLVEARAALESKITTNLAVSPTGEYRILKSGDYSLKEMNDGQAFDFKYTDAYNVVQYWRPKKTIGREITFTNSKGRPHTIQIVGSSLRRGLVEGVTDSVLKLPADTLEAVSRVEVQTFVQNSPAKAYAIDSKIVLHEDGSAPSVIRHEFGHSVARYIWGRMNPYGEWDKAFKADGSRYVSQYARHTAEADRRIGLSEDFADGVADYLRDVESFRKLHPNRAALLDTVFRGGGETIAQSPFASGGVWAPIQQHYGRPSFVVRRWVSENPEIAGLGLILSGGAVTGAIVMYGDSP